ncbi:cytochrome C biogenesis protein [Thermococcus gorgonarius]|uniref:Cytochrome C biogenesis protein n=1 Tax=Thermococcus gorgonarius TaxID=71997 RepID=A0A2Z2MHM2_THEGO|nr:cytochrome c biogenesis protein CcdA [Thermococcus gorgonarius]ASJ01468.1 cytochrome C biogenesis protein [Thermococcus gorgonarius]
MRRALLIFVLSLIFAGFVAAGEVSYGGLGFHDVSSEEELNALISAHEGEYFFLFYHSQSCPACRYMKESVFPTQKAREVLSGINLVAIDVYKGRELTNLRYVVKEKVFVIQPENSGYYTPKNPGEKINVGVPGTPTMVLFKVENGEKVLKGVAVGALTPDGLEFFIKTAIGDELQNSTTNSTQTETAKEVVTEESSGTRLSLTVLLPIFSAGVLSVFSPCVLPVIAGALSLTFARRRVEVIIVGMVASFALLGALVGSLGSYASQIQGALYLIGGVGFILIGASFVSADLRARLERLLSFSPAEGIVSKKGIAYDFALGSALGATWLGCIAPYVGFAVITAALTGETLKGVVVMGTYGLGMGLTVYLITMSKDLGEWINRKLLSRGVSLGGKSSKWELALGLTLIALGMLMLTEVTTLKLWSKLFESLSQL